MDNLIEFAKEQCEIFPEDSYMGEYLRKTIKMLQAEPCEDAVSRANLLKKFEDRFIELQKAHQKEKQLGVNWCINTLKDMPPVTPTQRWIPVSERLPEENGFYLATCDGEICGENEPFTGLAEYENGKWVDDEEDYQCVLAWMPLPQPYKAESENKK
jgi:hypothetical protein